jgi:tRNA 2-thiouridine synthesizing protein A
MNHELDVRRLLCPLPVIKTQNKIKELRAGDLLTVICTDPGVLHDIPAWCKVHGHRVVSTHTVDRDIEITIEVLT